MKRHIDDLGHWKESVGIFALLILAVFATELAVMQLFSPVFARMSTVAAGALDAGIVVLFCALPLWFMLSRLQPQEEDDPETPALRPGVLLLKALGGIFVVQFAIMQLLPELLPGADPLVCDMVDAAQTALICAIPLWRLLFNPAMRRRSVPLMDTPLRIYVLLLGTIFLADLLQELILPYRATSKYFGPGKIIDAFITTLCCAPLLWFLVARPLKAAARSEKARANAVYAQVIEALVVIGKDGIITSFNPAAEQIFGFAAEEMIGGSAEQLFEDGRLGLESLMAKSASGSGQDPGNTSEYNCRRRDGLALIMNVSVSEVMLGQEAEFLLIMRDITSRKAMEGALRESEHRFRQIFQQSEDAILFVKPGGMLVLDANDQAEQVFGYTKAELQRGALERCCQPDHLSDLIRVISSIDQETRGQLDFACRRKDGAEMVVSLRGRLMYLQGVPITHCTFRDVTERVRMEERTREIQSRLIQTNKMSSLGLLVSGVAHEINNPNNFIMNNCELLERIFDDTFKALKEYVPEEEGIYLGGIPLSEAGEHARRLVEGIASGSRRVNDIVDELKGFARQQPNQKRCEIDLNQVARSAVSLLQHELIKYTDNFHLELTEHLPPVCGHGQHLGQVIINLVMNACQALPGKESGIWLGTGVDQDGQVTISVRDQGCGISREDSSRVLEPFFTTKLDCGGTGLGLSISESIVKEHGGTLEFTTQAGRGTTFVVRLPAALPAEKGAATG